VNITPDIKSIALFFILFVPGFISMKVYDMLVPREERDYAKTIYAIIAYSVFNLALIYPLLGIIQKHIWAWYLCIFALPVLTAYLFFKVITSGWLNRLTKEVQEPILTPWDWVFRKKKPYWVIVRLKDGSRIGGVYSEGSYASKYPAKEQIYLEKVYTLDDNDDFVEMIPGSAGMIIFGEEILAVELYSSVESEDGSNEQEETEEQEYGKG
jgi:hypothetical protein